MVTLSPSVIVISLVTRNGSFSTCFRRTDEPFVGGWQHGVREIGGLDARQRNLHLALHEDLAARDAEIEIGRRVDARFGNVDDAQVLAVDADFAVGQVVAPLDLARNSRACPRRPWRWS